MEDTSASVLIMAATTPQPDLNTFYNLPPEVMGEIFATCTLEDDADPLVAIRLAQVCRYWREVAHSSPRVWTECRLDAKNHSIACLRNIAEYWLMRAQTLPLAVDLTFDSPDILLPVLAPFMNRPAQLQSCRLVTNNKVNLDPFLFIDDHQPPRLAELVVNLEVIEEAEEVDGGAGAGVAANPAATGEEQRSRSKKQYSKCTPFDKGPRLVSMELWLPILPTPDIMPPLSTLTSLFINLSHPTKAVPTASQLLNFLSLFPALKTLRFDGMQEEMTDTSKTRDDQDKVPDDQMVVTLPLLRSLTLYNTCSMRSLLSHLNTPALTELQLLYLNVDFEIGTGYPDDPGDSNVPSGERDYSQSPFSDRATGLGLRALMERSTPPLKTLIMDYADMRTDDFKWCFEHLDKLEEFSIVASDMADKVLLHMLEVPGDVLEGASELKVNVPKLHTLDLRRCQRLSGDAIQQAITQRIQYCNAHAGSMLPFSSVRVVECSNFAAEHEDAIRNLIPNHFWVTDDA